MEVKLLKSPRSLSKLILYLASLILFMKFYFIEQFMEYLDGKTTYFLSVESNTDRDIEAPTILLCHKNHNPYFLKNFNDTDNGYGAEEQFLLRYENVPDYPGLNKWYFLEKSTFTLDKKVFFFICGESTPMMAVKLMLEIKLS